MAFSLIVLSTLKQDCEINTIEILSFLPFKNNSVTIGLNFFISFHICYHITKQYWHCSFLCWIIIFQIFVDIINSLWIINECFLIFYFFKSYFFSSINKQLILWFKWIFDISGCWCFIKFNNTLVLSDSEPPIIKILYKDSHDLFRLIDHDFSSSKKIWSSQC